MRVRVFLSELGHGSVYCINWLPMNIKKALEQKFKGSDKIIPGNIEGRAFQTEGLASAKTLKAALYLVCLTNRERGWRV